MMETGGHDVDSIASLFGVERRRVTERLRYGRVHPDIRRAARAKEISLDVMKAFASHPDHGTQWAVFEATEGSYRQAWTIRDRLEKAGIKIGSDLGRYVEEAYRAADGPITADLIEEDSVLTDEALVERLLVEKLGALADAERARLGFAWAEGRRTADYEALRAYGRTYPSPIEPDGAAAERVTQIADRLVVIDYLRDEAEANDDGTDLDALEDEYEALQQEHEELTTGYVPEQLAKAGVIAHWRYDGPQVIYGLIRPEDMAPAEGEARPSGSAGAGGAAPGTEGPEGDGNEGTAPLEVAASLAADLRTERAVVIGAGLAADPALAQDLALFKIVSDLWNAHGTRVSWAMGITASRGERPHGKPDGMDQGPTEGIAALRDGVDLTWMDGTRSVTERFEAFRLLDAEMKARIVAVAMAEAIAPSDLSHGETLLCHVARQVVPDLRAVWRPTGEAFFGRIRKAQLLHLLATDLKQPEEAARLATAKKVDVVDYLERLFAAPFATLTPEQHEAVETWCPPGMAIPELRERHRIEVADTTNPEVVIGEDDDETSELDPEEAFDPDEEFGAEEDVAEEVPETEAA
jgi:ParB family chromosome partitioning protein